jgi:DNA-binding transcriptional ArsR family regulator
MTYVPQRKTATEPMPDDVAKAPVHPSRSQQADGRRHVETRQEQRAGASDFLKALSHEGRLMILCSLAHGEKSVTELEQMLSSRQAAVSQQLARLRQEKLITARREGKQIFYSLTDERARRIIEQVYELFCT